jgi:hypothetical protein
VQFADLSLHHIHLSTSETTPSSTKWVREESLSRVKQVEVLDQDTVRIESELDYVKRVNQKGSLADAPQRIIERYRENFQYLIKQVTSLVNRAGHSSIKDSL